MSYQYGGGAPSSGGKRQYGGNSGDSHDQKRYRQNEDGGSSSNKPSRAIVVRGLPNDCLESELLALVGPFASVEKCVLTPSKNEALVHLSDLSSATNLVTFYQSRDALVRGQKVVFAYAPPSRDSYDSPSHTSSTGPPQSSSRSSYNNGASSSSRLPPQQQASPYDRPRSDPRADRHPPSYSGFDRRGDLGPPPSSSGFDRRGDLGHTPSSNTYDSRRGGHSPPSTFDRSRAPPPQSSGFDRQHAGPPRYQGDVGGRTNPPPSYDSRGAHPTPSFERNAPPSSSYSRNPPPSFDRRSFDRPGPPPAASSSYDPRRPPTASYDPRGPPPSSYPASAAPEPFSGKNTILMVSISKMDYPVNVDVLHQVFSKYGTVMKVVTFTQRGEFRALVQFQTTEMAEAAQAALDGRDIYTGCNTLHLHMSTHRTLNVQCNNDKMRDFFNPNLPSVDPAEHHGELPARGMLGDMPPGRGFDRPGPPDSRDVRGRDFGPPDSRDVRGRGGDFGHQPPPHHGGGSFDPPSGAAFRRDDGRDDRPGPRRSRSRDRRSRSRERDFVPGAEFRGRTTVLICSNLDPRYVKVLSLFTMFGCFGDVLRVKVMFRKPGTALIQFVDERHAQSAREHMNGLALCNQKLRVDYSKHLMVVMPGLNADQFEIQNTRDFTNTPYHRYRKRPLSEVVPATTLLHVSGIPVSMQVQPGDTVASSRLLTMFAEWGVIKKFHPIAKQPKMMLLEMGAIEEAFDAMIALDNFTFNDGRIRVSFSKSYQRQ